MHAENEMSTSNEWSMPVTSNYEKYEVMNVTMLIILRNKTHFCQSP